MAAALADKNDRLRTVAYAYFEHNPDKAIVPRLLDALNSEESEFVRPALTRALAAYGDDPRVRQTMDGAGHAGPGLLPQRRHRGARRLPRRLRAQADHRGRQARRPAAGRCGAGAREDWRQARAAGAGRSAADRAARIAAGHRRRDLPARHQLRVAPAATSSSRCGSRSRTSASRSWFARPRPALAVLAVAGREDAAVGADRRSARRRSDPVRAPIALAIRDAWRCATRRCC